MSKFRGAKAKAGTVTDAEFMEMACGVGMTQTQANEALQKAKTISKRQPYKSAQGGPYGPAPTQGLVAQAPPPAQAKGQTAHSYQDTQEVTRQRSFVERYVIERAATFRAGHESEDAWQAILDGNRMYRQIAHVSNKPANPTDGSEF